MPREELEKLSAGPELDALIAEHVFKFVGVRLLRYDNGKVWKAVRNLTSEEVDYYAEASIRFNCHDVKRYSANIGSAWDIWEKAEYAELVRSSNNHVRCHLDFGDGVCGQYEGRVPEVVAICKAALNAVL